MNKQPLLSICIPTRNRADVLKPCLDSIVNSKSFTSDIEVIVSDNCSEDETQKLTLEYVEKYPNIKYYRNDSNLGGDRNILLSLERGSGIFLKLNNDYSIFKKGSLEYLVSIVKDNLNNKPALFFHNGSRTDEKKVITDFNEIFKQERWGMSWIGGYGYWKEDFDNFEERDRRIATRFQQIDWFIRSFKKKKQILCINYPLTERLAFKSKQGNYNFIEVHTRNFLVQFEELIPQGLLKKETIEFVKKESLMPAMVNWAIKFKIANKGRFSYNSNDSFKLIKKEFGYYPWYRKELIKNMIRSIYSTIKVEYIKPLLKKSHLLK